MAEFDYTALIGDFSVAPSPAELNLIREVDTGLRFRNSDKFFERPASSQIIPINVASVAAGAAVPSIQFRVPYPMKLWAVDAGAREFGTATALTADVLVNRGSGFASVLDAATDLFAAGEGVMTRFAPEDGSEDLAAGDIVRIDFQATTGAVTDAMALLIGQRI